MHSSTILLHGDQTRYRFSDASQERRFVLSETVKGFVTDMGAMHQLQGLKQGNAPYLTKLLVTALPHVTARQVLWLYYNRWSVEREPLGYKEPCRAHHPKGTYPSTVPHRFRYTGVTSDRA